METKEKTSSSWIKKKPEEVEKLIVELARKNTPPEKIGLILRDLHGIPKARIFGKKIGQVLRQNNIESNSEYDNTVKKIDTLRKHFAKHKHDYTPKRLIVKYTARLNKLKKLQQK